MSSSGGETDSMDLASVYAFTAFLVVFCVWMVVYLFFSAMVLGMAVSFLLNTFILQGRSAIQAKIQESPIYSDLI